MTAKDFKARVCQCGCKRELRKPDGTPDYRRRFYGKDCLDLDKRNRTHFKRWLRESNIGPNLVLGGVEIAARSVGEFVRELRRLGHDVQVLRTKPKARAAKGAK